jgi:hypothetical protein
VLVQISYFGMSESDHRQTKLFLFWLCLILIPGAATIALKVAGIVAAVAVGMIGLVAIVWVIQSRPAKMTAHAIALLMRAAFLIFAGFTLCYSVPMSFGMLTSHDPGMRIGGVIALLCFAVLYWVIARARKRARTRAASQKS